MCIRDRDVRLGVEEVQVRDVRRQDGIVERGRAREGGVQAACRVDVEQLAQGAAAHVGLHDEHLLARRGDGVRKVRGHDGLALVLLRGGDHDGLHLLVHRGEADVRQKRLRRVGKLRMLEAREDLLALLGHVSSPYPSARACGPGRAAPEAPRLPRGSSRWYR